MKLSQLTEALRLNTRDADWSDKFDKVKMKLVNAGHGLSVEFSIDELLTLRDLVKAIPIDDARREWEGQQKAEMLADAENLIINRSNQQNVQQLAKDIFDRYIAFLDREHR